MKTRKPNKYLVIANISALTYFLIGRFIPLPDFVLGFCLGICLVFYPIGLYGLKHDLNKLQDFKKTLIGKIVQ